MIKLVPNTYKLVCDGCEKEFDEDEVLTNGN